MVEVEVEAMQVEKRKRKHESIERKTSLESRFSPFRGSRSRPADKIRTR